MQNLETLRQQQPEQKFSWSETMTLMAPVIDAVCYLHRQRPAIIHGAIQPTNIIVPKVGDRAILVDPGMVQEYDPGLTETAVHVRAEARTEASSRPYPGYRAPEQHGGVLDTRTDVYGLGATFYTLLTGIVPPDGLSRHKYVASGEIDPLQPVHEVLSTVPGLVAEAIHQAMALEAAHRFSSVEQFWEVLWEAVLNPAPIVQSAHISGSTTVASSNPPGAEARTDARSRPYRPYVKVTLNPVPLEPPASASDSTLSAPSGPSTGPEQERVVGAWQPQGPIRRPTLPPATTFHPHGKQLAISLGIPLDKSGDYIRFLIPLVLLIGLGIAIGLGVLSDAASHPHPHSHPVTPTASGRPQGPTHPSHPLLAPTGQAPSLQPQEGTYKGTMYDLTTNVSTSLSLTGVRQSQRKINGYLIVGPELQGSGPFSGAIDAAGHVQFTVTTAAGNSILLFEGAVQSATSLSGVYYSCSGTQESLCSWASGDYGIWSVTLT